MRRVYHPASLLIILLLTSEVVASRLVFYNISHRDCYTNDVYANYSTVPMYSQTSVTILLSLLNQKF